MTIPENPDVIVSQMFFYLEIVFKSRWIAPVVFFPAFIVLALLIAFRAWVRIAPFRLAVWTRKKALRAAFRTAASTDEKRLAFAKSFEAVSGAMVRGRRGVGSLIRAWDEFRECLIDDTATPICNTARPWTYFQRAVPRRQEIVFWSNFFVGLGLVLTFFGIVVALNTAAQGMHEGATVQESQAALRELLIVASAKFFSSIGGLLASLILRFVDARITKISERDVHQLCDLLEQGLSYVPMQRLGVFQLEELKRQSSQLEKFNTDLALSIGEQIGKQFQNVISPVQSSLDALGDSMRSMSSNLGEKLGEGVGKAIETASSGELRALANTLEALRDQLDRLSQAVGGSGDEAAQKIRAAGADFAQAASDIKEAFAGLTSQVRSLGDTLTGDAQTVRSEQAELHQTAITQLKQALTEAANATAAGTTALEAAAQKATAEIGDRIGDAMNGAMKSAGTTLHDEIESAGARFAEAAKPMIDAIETATSRIAALGGSIEQGQKHAERTAEAFLATSDRAREVAGSMSEAATGFVNAATPVATASRSLQEAASAIRASTEEGQRTTSNMHQAMVELVSEIRNTQEAAAGAWNDYRARFEGVDKSLENVFLQFAEKLGDAMRTFSDFAEKFDAEMGKAVGRLAQTVTVIEENSDSIASLADAMRRSEAAE